MELRDRGVDEPKQAAPAEERTVMRSDLTEQLRSMTAAVDAAEAGILPERGERRAYLYEHRLDVDAPPLAGEAVSQSGSSIRQVPPSRTNCTRKRSP